MNELEAYYKCFEIIPSEILHEVLPMLEDDMEWKEDNK